jgi:hypothetical protein
VPPSIFLEERGAVFRVTHSTILQDWDSDFGCNILIISRTGKQLFTANIDSSPEERHRFWLPTYAFLEGRDAVFSMPHFTLLKDRDVVFWVPPSNLLQGRDAVFGVPPLTLLEEWDGDFLVPYSTVLQDRDAVS